MRVRFGVFFVNIIPELCFSSVTGVLYGIYCHTWPCYNGIRLYINSTNLSASDWISSKSFTQPSISDLKNIHHIFGTYSWNWRTVVGFNVVVFHVYLCPPSQRCPSKPWGQGQYMEDPSTHTRAGINENRRSKEFSLKTTRASGWLYYMNNISATFNINDIDGQLYLGQVMKVWLSC